MNRLLFSLKTCQKSWTKFLEIFFTHEKNGGKFGTAKNPKIKSSQNQNPFCPNCRRDFFMPEKGVPVPFGALPAHFFHRPEKYKNCSIFAYFPWWAHGPYSPGLGPLLPSTRGGAIGNPVKTSSSAFRGSVATSGKAVTICSAAGKFDFCLYLESRETYAA